MPVELLLGRDLIGKTGIHEGRLPQHYPDVSPQQSVSNKSPGFDESFDDDTILSENSAEILSTVKSVLDVNQSLPKNTHCNLPEAIILLEVKDSDKPNFTPQYSIPYKYRAAVDKKVTEWLDSGVIIPAPLDCPHNNPLTCAPKKDEFGNKTGIRVCLDPRKRSTV